MTRELLTFEIARQLFGLDMAAIRGIRGWSPLAQPPGMPPHLAGLVAWGGAILPILDLGARLGWGATRAGEQHAILIVQTGWRMAGLLVDGLSDLLLLAEASLQSVPLLEVEEAVGFIDGLTPVGNRMLLVLNLEAMLAGLNRSGEALRDLMAA